MVTSSMPVFNIGPQNNKLKQEQYDGLRLPLPPKQKIDIKLKPSQSVIDLNTKLNLETRDSSIDIEKLKNSGLPKPS